MSAWISSKRFVLLVQAQVIRGNGIDTVCFRSEFEDKDDAIKAFVDVRDRLPVSGHYQEVNATHATLIQMGNDHWKWDRATDEWVWCGDD